MSQVNERLKNIEVAITSFAAIVDNFLPHEQQEDLRAVMTHFLTAAKKEGHDILGTLTQMRLVQDELNKVDELKKSAPKIIMPDEHARH